MAKPLSGAGVDLQNLQSNFRNNRYDSVPEKRSGR